MSDTKQNGQPQRVIDPEASTLILGFVDRSGKWVGVGVPVTLAFAAYKTIHEIGHERAAQLIEFARIMSEEISKADVPDPSLSFSSLLEFLEGRKPASQEEKTEQEKQQKQEELVVEFCYDLLTQGVLSRTLSAEFARALLNKPISEDAWRLKVDRWAKRQGRDPVGLPRGRKKQKP